MGSPSTVISCRDPVHRKEAKTRVMQQRRNAQTARARAVGAVDRIPATALRRRITGVKSGRRISRHPECFPPRFAFIHDNCRPSACGFTTRRHRTDATQISTEFPGQRLNNLFNAFGAEWR